MMIVGPDDRRFALPIEDTNMKLMKHILLTIAVVLASHGSAAAMGATGDAIKSIVNEWTGQHVSTHIAGETLYKAGCQLEYVTAGYDSLFNAIADGEIHATLEVWSSNAPDLWMKMAEAGKVEAIVENGIAAHEGFLCPVPVKEM